MNKPYHTCLGLIAASLLAGCASTEKTVSTDKPAAAKEEYVRYTPTGSWVSKKVKKEQVKTSDKETAEAQMAMGELQRRANDVPKDPEGGRRN